MDVRRQELADIEARLAKLRTQLDRRREKKDDIVDLQYQVAINEAEGLGFTSRAEGQSVQHSRRVADDLRAGGRCIGGTVPVGDSATAATEWKLGRRLSRPRTTARGEGRTQSGCCRNAQRRVTPSLDIAVDGDFGPETKKRRGKISVSRNELKQTGVVDAATWKALEPPEQVIGPVLEIVQ